LGWFNSDYKLRSPQSPCSDLPSIILLVPQFLRSPTYLWMSEFGIIAILSPPPVPGHDPFSESRSCAHSTRVSAIPRLARACRDSSPRHLFDHSRTVPSAVARLLPAVRPAPEAGPDRSTVSRSHVTRSGPTDSCRIRCPGPDPSKHSGGHSTMPALTPGCRRPLPTAVAVRVPLPGPGAAAGPWRCHCHCLFAPSSVRPPELPPQCVALAPDSGLPQPLASDRSSSMPLPAPARLRSRGLAAATAFSLRAASDRPSYRHSARLFAS